MIQILKIVFSIYSITVFFLLGIPLLISFLFLKFLPYEKQIEGVYRHNRVFVFTLAALTGYSIKFIGIERLDKTKTYIVVSNHNNLIDMLGSAYGCRIAAKPLVKREIGDIPILGALFQLSSLLVDRYSKDSRERVLETMRDELQRGISLMIFPEGTRNRTPKPLKDFHKGAFELAIDAQVPILLVVYTNMRKLGKPDSLLVEPGVIEINYLDPIYPTGYTMDKMEDLKQVCYKTIWNYLVENDQSFKEFQTI